MTLAERFAEAEKDWQSKFDDIEQKRSSRPDLHAFLLLNELLPDTSDIVSASEHDEIWLGVDCAKLAEVITDAQIVELARCGVHYDDYNDSLQMFT
jgi:hypothetical protein